MFSIKCKNQNLRTTKINKKKAKITRKAKNELRDFINDIQIITYMLAIEIAKIKNNKKQKIKIRKKDALLACDLISQSATAMAFQKLKTKISEDKDISQLTPEPLPEPENHYATSNSI